MEFKSVCENLKVDEFRQIILESKNLNSKCDRSETFCHIRCFYEISNVTKPKLIDEDTRDLIAKYYKNNEIKVQGLMSLNYLNLLNETKSPTTTWLKYETLIVHLIKEQLYEPKSLANELLSIVKDEIPQNIASKFASVLESCVKYCRDANKDCSEEEEEEKWCEIIDWMSWFIGSSE